MTVTSLCPRVSITKTLVGESGSVAGQAEPGERLTNTGGSAVSDYGVTDRYDVNTHFVSADNGGTDNGTAINWSNLTVPAQTGSTPGTLVLTAQLQVADPLPVGTTAVANVAYRSGDPEPVAGRRPINV
ncbi:hypothetical protein [Brucella grignonensis]|uniref:Putative parallel beta-helix repeat-containing transcriptional regulator AraC n=1 Tax=Brucella grignonensis TaxID=94627 RepID=A0A256F0N7_9HYPH|nr:hypothetical protein [Brucella grignonensis]OYR08353.1 putative parallel beta-helix repeat-containing transcriptional regulator AraC [Brucella grignonensis]